MSRVEDFSFEDVMRMAVKLFGSDAGMESCKDIEELTENIGQEQIDRIVTELDNQ